MRVSWATTLIDVDDIGQPPELGSGPDGRPPVSNRASHLSSNHTFMQARRGPSFSIRELRHPESDLFHFCNKKVVMAFGDRVAAYVCPSLVS